VTGGAAFATIAHVTIREHFVQLARRLNYVWVALAFAIVGVGMWRYPHTSPFTIGLVMGAVLIGPIILVGRRVFRCPRCQRGYQQMRKQQPDRRRDLRMYWEVWEACPNCQLSFDEPWSKPGAAGK
jgi:hypothetical protein